MDLPAPVAVGAPARVRLRQAVLAARELRPAVAELQQALGLGEPFRDPGVAMFGLENAVFAVGDCFLEVVAPVAEDAPAARYLRGAGEGGYMVMFDLSDLESARRRAKALSVRAVWEIDLPDISGTHLHPSDIGGAIVSIDGSRPYGSWRWGGPSWTGARPEPGAGRLAGVTLAVRDPRATGERWASVLGVPLAAGDGEVRMATEDGWVRMVERPGELPERLVEVALELPGGSAHAGAAAKVLGVRFSLLAGGEDAASATGASLGAATGKSPIRSISAGGTRF